MPDLTLAILDAINVRNRVRSGLDGPEWVRQQLIRLVEEGLWSDPQIAALCQYARQSVAKIAAGVERPAQRPMGGALDVGSLDLILELRGAVVRGVDPSPLLIQGVIKTGTSTKLVSRLTGISLGVVLYQQRKMQSSTEEE